MNILEYENYQEKILHGDPLFPYITYLCSIPLDFGYVPMHWHDEMEIIYIKKGNGTITVDFTQHTVSAGDIALILPGQLHSIGQFESESMEYENIIFHPNMLISKKTDTCNTDYLVPLLSGNVSLPLLYTPDSPHYAEISACIDANDEICKTYPSGYQLFIKGQLFLLFYILLHKCSTKEPSGKDRSKSLEKMKLILKYVENNYMEKIGGDGITVRDTDGALIEHNLVRDCRYQNTGYNVGIWPFEAANTVIQYNEAYDTHSVQDGQGLDCDHASSNSVMQYNYSHNNEGGFMLIMGGYPHTG